MALAFAVSSHFCMVDAAMPLSEAIFLHSDSVAFAGIGKYKW